MLTDTLVSVGGVKRGLSAPLSCVLYGRCRGDLVPIVFCVELLGGKFFCLGQVLRFDDECARALFVVCALVSVVDVEFHGVFLWDEVPC